MKKDSLRKLGRTALFLVLLAVAAIGCKNKITDIPYVDPEFAEYVSAYTSGLVPSDGDIQIVLQTDSYQFPGKGKEASEKLFSFSPSVKGKTYWKDSRTIVFHPDEPLKSGEIYIATFHLNKVCDVKSSKFNKMEFGFRVIPQDFEVQIVGISASEQQKDIYKLEGYVYTADKATEEQARKMISVELDGRELKSVWKTSDGSRRFAFEASGIKCAQNPQKLIVKWNGKPIDVDKKGEKEITIPTKNEFRALYVSNANPQSPTFVVSFNEMVAPNQDLTGLISFNTSATVNYTIDGNQVWVYASDLEGNVKLTISPGVRSVSGKKTKTPYEMIVNLGKALPKLRSVSTGNILPNSESIIYPFEAIGLKSVVVQVVRIYEKNIGQFFQVNDMDGSNELRRVGVPIYKKRIDLQAIGEMNTNRWCRYALDLTKAIKSEPGAIYQISIYFRKKDVANQRCELAQKEKDDEENFDLEDMENSYGYGDYTDYYYDNDYQWSERDNPCNSAYYSSERMIYQNIMASDLGIIAKMGKDNKVHVTISNIKNAEPISGVNVEAYNYQQIRLGKAQTDENGMAAISYAKGKPFLIIAKWKHQRGYLKVDDGNSLSMSNFEVSGDEIAKGVKAFITGERGVWRPGDSIFVTFIVEDRSKIIPKGIPIIFDLNNPKGQLTKRLIQRYDGSSMYAFRTATSPDAITGTYTGVVKIGGLRYSKGFRVETIKPNRLKISLTPLQKRIEHNGQLNAELNVRWLHGAPAPGLKSVYQAILSKAQLDFKNYSTYQFDDEDKRYTRQSVPLADGRLNDNGEMHISHTFNSSDNLPSALNVSLKGEVFEPGGEFSIDQTSIPYYPYSTYVGMKMPDKESYWYNTNHNYKISIVTLNSQQRKVASHVAVEVYKMKNSWWFDHDENSEASYINSSYSELISRKVVPTPQGVGAYNFRIDYPEWGDYYIRMVDTQSGHSCGKLISVYWPYEMGVNENLPEGAALLPISISAQKVEVGQKCTVTFPGSENARALVSIENGSKVISQEWVKASNKSNTYTIKTSEAMSPNVYVSVWLIRPYNRKDNDMPIRQYGVMKLKVENKKTHLEPVITMPSVIKPEQNVTIKVKEKSGKPMSYTIAVVDEGLLDISNYKTPNPWNTFYAEEALGVKSWDVYNRVIGAYGGIIERYFTIGGSEELKATEQGKSIRFKPVVKFFGPFKVGRGGSSLHSFKMPNYVGSVKTMVIASNSDNAYGSAEKTSTVKLDVMAVPTLPRVLGPTETITMPVNVFAMSPSAKQVTVSVKVQGNARIEGAASQHVAFAHPGDKMVAFRLKAGSATGKAKITVTAKGGKDVSTQTVELYVREPRQPETRIVEAVIGGGKTWNYHFAPFGTAGTNKAYIEMSTFTPINLMSRLDYLITYPYGCIEQTTSSVFPQLYLNRLMPISKKQKDKIEANIKAGIERILSMQTADGGFSYWKGSYTSDNWGSNYAGHFLLEARAAGYSVPESAISRWISHQASTARNWNSSEESASPSSQLMQAYRLYTLALAQRPELGSMNLLKEKANVSSQTLWRLASAYSLVGQRQVAKKLIAKLPTTFKFYKNDGETYGSSTRDLAMAVETLTELGMTAKAANPIKRLSQSLGSHQWMSTQETAYALLAIAKTRNDIKPGFEVNAIATINGKQSKINEKSSLAQIEFTPSASNKISITNRSGKTNFVRVIMHGTPRHNSEAEYSNNLSLKVRYTGIHGESIDPASIPQGTDFLIITDVVPSGMPENYRNITLSQIFPSGWEVQNPRLTGETDSSSPFTYQDIRDDRVYTHFDLTPGEAKRFVLKAKATYAGHFYLPRFKAEAMYDNSISAGSVGQWVDVTFAK